MSYPKITVGTDIVELSRMEESLKNPRFLTRVFSKEEQDFFSQKASPLHSIVANFAGKEAFSKTFLYHP